MTHVPRPFAPGRRRFVLRLVANGVAQAATGFAAAAVIAHAFDALVRSERPPSGRTIAGYALALALTAVLGGALRWLERVDAERLGQAYVGDIRLRLHRHLIRSSPRALQRRSRGATIVRFVSDLAVLRQWASLGLARLLVGVSLTAGLLVALAFLAPLFALATGVVVALGAVAGTRQGRALRVASRRARRERGRLAAEITEHVTGLATVQASGQGRRERRRLRERSDAVQVAMVDVARRAGALRAMAEATPHLAAGAIVLAGVGEVTSGRVTAGTVVAAVSLVHRLGHPLRDLGRVQEYWHASRVGVARIEEVLSSPTGVTHRRRAPALGPGPGRLELVDVHVDGALHGITATAEPGQTVAVVGPNGAGKSTLLALVARLTDASAGQVLLDGEDVARRSIDSVRQAVGMASPELPLLRGTVERNVRYRFPQATATETAEIIDLCDLGPLLRSLPQGKRTRVGDNGGGLSLGQRQQIGLARALLGRPRVLLLDEAETGLDPSAAAVLDGVLAERRATVLLVTHQRERAIRADVIWHLEGGHLVDAGTPDALLAGTGPTALLFSSSRQEPAPRA